MPALVEPSHVEQLMDEYDANPERFFVKYGGGESTRYWVASPRRGMAHLYPPAAIAQAALGWSDINAGYSKPDSACRVLERSGFRIVDVSGNIVDANNVQSRALAQFDAETAALSNTERDQLRRVRVGQRIFRDELIRLRAGVCEVTGLSEQPLLRASHIKPWAECETSIERLDPENGILLSAHWDAAFDRGLISFDDAGKVLVSGSLSRQATEILGIEQAATLDVGPRRASNLAWHRRHCFQID